MVSTPFFETTCLYILLQFLRFHYHHLHHISIVLPQLPPTSTSPLFFHCFPPPSFYFCRSPHPPISSPTYVFGFSSLYSSSSSSSSSITTTCALSTPHLPFTDLTSAPSTRMRWSRNWIALAWLHHPSYDKRRKTQPEPILSSSVFIVK